jgi:hypothetical protein
MSKKSVDQEVQEFIDETIPAKWLKTEIELDLDDSEEGVKFLFFTSWIDPATGETHFNEPESDAYAIIRPMTPYFEAADKGRKKVSQLVHDPKTRSMKMSEPQYPPLSKAEEDRRIEDAWDYAIMEIGGFRNKRTGEMYPSDRETKLKMIKKPIIITWLNRCFELMGNAGIEVKKAAEGN